MTTYSKDNLLNSELAVVVLRELRKDSSYGSKISKEIDKPQTSIDRVIQGLYEHNFIRKGKRTRAQFYQFDPLLLGEYWFDEISRECRNIEPDIEKYEHISNSESDDIDLSQIIENNEENITNFGRVYLDNYFAKYFSEAKLGEALFKSPYSSLNWHSRKKDLPEYLAAVFLCLESKINMSQAPKLDEIDYNL